MMRLLFALAILCVGFPAYSQVVFGLKAGMSSSDLSPEDLVVYNKTTAENFSVTLKDAQYSPHFGAFLRIGKKFFVQPEVSFNTQKATFQIEELTTGDAVNRLKEEKYHYLDIPFHIGLKSGIFRMQGGPVGHILINNSSELTDLSGYGQNFDNFTLGWQAGIGLDLWKFALDLRYEGNFSKFGDHINFFGEEYQFDQTPGRFIGSIGFMF